MCVQGRIQRRRQVSLAGGADRIPGGGINLNTYSYGKRDRPPRGGSNLSRGLSPPPPWLRAWAYTHDFRRGRGRDPPNKLTSQTSARMSLGGKLGGKFGWGPPRPPRPPPPWYTPCVRRSIDYTMRDFICIQCWIPVSIEV